MRLLTLLLVVVSLAVPSVAGACRNPPPSPAKIASLPSQYPLFYRALRVDFGRHWVEAAIVSWKEGSWHYNATNGCYLGTFQMGCHERSTYGHGPTLAEQSHAAARYWRLKGWGPWECKPW